MRFTNKRKWKEQIIFIYFWSNRRPIKHKVDLHLILLLNQTTEGCLFNVECSWMIRCIWVFDLLQVLLPCYAAFWKWRKSVTMKVAMMRHCNAVVRQSVGQSILATFPALAHFVHSNTRNSSSCLWSPFSPLLTHHSSLDSSPFPVPLPWTRGCSDTQTLGHTHRFKSAENKRN